MHALPQRESESRIGLRENQKWIGKIQQRYQLETFISSNILSKDPISEEKT